MSTISNSRSSSASQTSSPWSAINPLSSTSVIQELNCQLYLRSFGSLTFFLMLTVERISDRDDRKMKYGAKFALIMFGVFTVLIEKSLKANIRTLAIFRRILQYKQNIDQENINQGRIVQEAYYAFESERVMDEILGLFQHVRRCFQSHPVQVPVERGKTLLNGCKALLLLYRAFVIVGLSVSSYLMHHLPLGVFTHNIFASAVNAIFVALFTSDSLQVALVLAISVFLEVLDDGINLHLFIEVVYKVAAVCLVVLFVVAIVDFCTVLHLRKLERNEKDPQIQALLRAVPRRGRPMDISPTLAVTNGNLVPKDIVVVGTFLERRDGIYNVCWRVLSGKTERVVRWRVPNHADGVHGHGME